MGGGKNPGGGIKGNPANGNGKKSSLFRPIGFCCGVFGRILFVLWFSSEFLLSPTSIELSELWLSGELIDGDAADLGCLVYSSNPNNINSSFVQGGLENRPGGYAGCPIILRVFGDIGAGFCDPFWCAAAAACCCSCKRQWILNQFDLLPYRDPLFDIPTSKHFRNRQALHAVLFFLLITHSPLFLHSEIDDRLLYDLPKNDCNKTKKKLKISVSQKNYNNWNNKKIKVKLISKEIKSEF